jgi:hypothetical protein
MSNGYNTEIRVDEDWIREQERKEDRRNVNRVKRYGEAYLRELIRRK